MNILDQSLAQLARSTPGARAILHKYRLDFCCGAKQTLRDAAAKHALDPEVIAALKNDLMDHIHLENNSLFDRIYGLLGSAHHG